MRNEELVVSNMIRDDGEDEIKDSRDNKDSRDHREKVGTQSFVVVSFVSFVPIVPKKLLLITNSSLLTT